MRNVFRVAQAVLVLCCLGIATTVFADQVIFQPGPSPGKDMWLSSVYNQTAVDDEKLQVGGWGDEYRMFIQFDLTGLPQTATSAVIWLYSYPRGDSSTPVAMPLYLLTNSWSETTQNFYTQLYGYSLGTIPAPTPNSWYGIEIANIYNGWKNGTYVNDGLVFLPASTNNEFSMFYSSDYDSQYYWVRPKLVVTYDGANLAFPLHNGWTPYTATILAVVDHSNTNGFGCADGVVTTYTGERGVDNGNNHSTWNTGAESGTCPNDVLYGYKNSSGTPFVVNHHYDTSNENEGGLFLFYDGHTGYDYPVPNGTTVYAAASGIAHPYTGSGGSYDVMIDHQNGYYTYYLHLSSRSIYDGQSVNTNTSIGSTGSGHLHFTVKKGTQRVDPYGWTGEYGTDPLQADGHDNVCLWQTCQWW